MNDDVDNDDNDIVLSDSADNIVHPASSTPYETLHRQRNEYQHR